MSDECDMVAEVVEITKALGEGWSAYMLPELDGGMPDLVLAVSHGERDIAQAFAREHTCFTALLHLARVLAGTKRAEDPEFDATEDAHPAWWRGSDYGAERTAKRLAKAAGYAGQARGQTLIHVVDDAVAGLVSQLAEARRERDTLRRRVEELEARQTGA